MLDDKNVFKNDWFAAVIKNPTLSYTDFQNAGLTLENTGLNDIDYYRDIPDVQKAFTRDGVFDDEAYTKMYNMALQTYNTFQMKPVLESALDAQVLSPYNNLADSARERYKKRIVETEAPNYDNLSKGLTSLWGEEESKFSLRERAERNNIFDSETGLWRDYSVNSATFWGMSGFLPRIINNLTENLVYATWDSDGVHTDYNGNKVQHYKGEYKYDKKREPFVETLGNRDIYDKETVKLGDVLTVDGTALNKIDFFDSDGKTKSVAGTAMKTVAAVVPYFIPYVGPVWTGASILYGAGQAFAAASKMIGQDDHESGSFSTGNKLYAWLDKFEGGMSDKAQREGFFTSIEQWGNMLSDIPALLKQQRGIAQTMMKIPGWLNKELKGLKVTLNAVKKYALPYFKETGHDLAEDIAKNAVVETSKYADFFSKVKTAQMFNTAQSYANKAKWISGIYMAITQTTPTLKDLQSYNMDSTTQYITAAALAAGYTWIFLQEFGLVALRGLGLNDLQKLGTNFTKTYVDKIAQDGGRKLVTSADKMGFLKKYTKLSYEYMANKIKDPRLASAWGEGFEEVTEEALQDAIVGFTTTVENTLKDLGVYHPDSERNTYSWIDTDPLTRYLSSAVGGAVGGAVFAQLGGIKKAEKINELLPENVRKDVIQAIANGLVDKIEKEVVKAVKKMGLSDTLSFETDPTLSTQEKPVYLVAADKSKSQRNTVVESIKGWLHAMDAIINNEGTYHKIAFDGNPIASLFTNTIVGTVTREDDLTKRYSKQFMADFIIQLSNRNFDDTIFNDIYNLLKEITDAKLTQDPNTGKMDEFNQTRYNNAKLRLDHIANGNLAWEYLDRLIFFASPGINSPFIKTNINTFAKSLGSPTNPIDYHSLNDEQKQHIRDMYDKYIQNNTYGTANRELAYKTFTLLRSKLSNSVEQLSKFDNGETTVDGERINNMLESEAKLRELFRKPEKDLLTESEIEEVLKPFRTFKEEDGTEKSLTDEEILKKFNPRYLSLSPDEKQRFVHNWLMSRGPVVEDGVDAQTALSYAKALKTLNQDIEGAKLQSGKLGFNSLMRLLGMKRILDVIDFIDNKNNKIENIGKFTADLLERSMNFIKTSTVELYDDLYSNLHLEDPKLVDDNRINEILKKITDSKSFFININGFETKVIKNTAGDRMMMLSDGSSGRLHKIEYDKSSGNAIIVYTDATKKQLVIKIKFDLFLNDLFKYSFINRPLHIATGAAGTFGILFNYYFDPANVTPPTSVEISQFTNDALNTSNTLLNKIQSIITTKSVANPVLDMLNEASKDVLGDSVFNFIASENNKLDSDGIRNYVLSGDTLSTRKKLLDALDFLTVSYSLLSSITKNVFNSEIEAANDMPGATKLNTISERHKDLMMDEVDNLYEQIGFMIKLSDAQSKNHLEISNLILAHNNATYAHLFLSGLNGTVLAPTSSLPVLTKLMNILKSASTIDVMDKLQEIIDSDNITDEMLLESDVAYLKVKKLLFDSFSALSDVEKDLLMDEISRDNQYVDLTVPLNINQKDISKNHLASTILSIISFDPVLSSQRYVDVMKTDKMKGYADIYTLKLQIEAIVAYLENDKWYKKYNKAVKDNNPDLPQLAVTDLVNFMFCSGRLGSGKTDVDARFISVYSELYAPSLKFLASGPTTERCNKMGSVTNFELNTINEVLKKILTPSAYEKVNKILDELHKHKNSDPGKSITIDGVEYKFKEKTIGGVNYVSYNNPETPYILDSDLVKKSLHGIDCICIDEITKIPAFIIDALDRAGIKIFGFGDMFLESYVVNKRGKLNPLSNCILTITSGLNIRSNNIHKRDNLSIVISYLQQAMSGNPIFIGQNPMVLHYWESIPSNGKLLLNGEKVVNSSQINDAYIELLVNDCDAAKKEKLGYIYDDASKAKALALQSKLGADKIDIIHIDDVQGQERKYMIIDCNNSFNELKVRGIDNVLSNVEMLIRLNTLMGRSSDGSVIIIDDPSLFDPEKQCKKINYTSEINFDATETEEYNKKIRDMLETAIKEATPPKKKRGGGGITRPKKVKIGNIGAPAEADLPDNMLEIHTYYNHYSISTTGTPKPSGRNEDLGNVRVPGSTEALDPLLYKGAWYNLRCYAMLRLLSGHKFTEAEENAVWNRKNGLLVDGEEKDQYIARLNNATFAIKASVKDEFDVGYDQWNENNYKEADEQGKPFYRLVMRVLTKNGLYDITVGVLGKASVDRLIKFKEDGAQDALSDLSAGPVYVNLDTSKLKNSVNVYAPNIRVNKPANEGDSKPFVYINSNGAVRPDSDFTTLNEVLSTARSIRKLNNGKNYVCISTDSNKTWGHPGRPYTFYSWNILDLNGGFDETCNSTMLSRIGYSSLPEYLHKIATESKAHDIGSLSSEMNPSRFAYAILLELNKYDVKEKDGVYTIKDVATGTELTGDALTKVQNLYEFYIYAISDNINMGDISMFSKTDTNLRAFLESLKKDNIIKKYLDLQIAMNVAKKELIEAKPEADRTDVEKEDLAHILSAIQILEASVVYTRFNFMDNTFIDLLEEVKTLEKLADIEKALEFICKEFSDKDDIPNYITGFVLNNFENLINGETVTMSKSEFRSAVFGALHILLDGSVTELVKLFKNINGVKKTIQPLDLLKENILFGVTSKNRITKSFISLFDTGTVYYGLTDYTWNPKGDIKDFRDYVESIIKVGDPDGFFPDGIYWLHTTKENGAIDVTKYDENGAELEEKFSLDDTDDTAFKADIIVQSPAIVILFRGEKPGQDPIISLGTTPPAPTGTGGVTTSTKVVEDLVLAANNNKIDEVEKILLRPEVTSLNHDDLVKNILMPFLLERFGIKEQSLANQTDDISVNSVCNTSTEYVYIKDGKLLHSTLFSEPTEDINVLLNPDVVNTDKIVINKDDSSMTVALLDKARTDTDAVVVGRIMISNFGVTNRWNSFYVMDKKTKTIPVAEDADHIKKLLEENGILCDGLFEDSVC